MAEQAGTCPSTVIDAFIQCTFIECLLQATFLDAGDHSEAEIPKDLNSLIQARNS
jgi:hypothetical protein